MFPIAPIALLAFAFWARRSRPGTRPMHDVTPVSSGNLRKPPETYHYDRSPAPKPERFEDPFARGAHHDECFDATWPPRFPDVLAERLRQILANPDG